ncbi:MAG: hypothetical protein MUC83_16280, partial [Pirellula sp.]|nr:hypothetical protein [Pirellula sp.]
MEDPKGNSCSVATLAGIFSFRSWLRYKKAWTGAERTANSSGESCKALRSTTRRAVLCRETGHDAK